MSWTGPYLGLSLGYAWAHDPNVNCVFTGLSPCPTTTFPAPYASGPLGTFQAGFNWQVGSWVIGLESDISALYAQGVQHFAGIDPAKGADQIATRYDWLGTARARAGYATGAHLLYATGGYAVGRVEHDYIYAIGHPNSQRFSSAQTRSGWTAGLGWEFALDRHLSFKAEYLHVRLDRSNLDLTGLLFGNTDIPTPNTVLRFNNNFDIFRVGMNLRY